MKLGFLQLGTVLLAQLNQSYSQEIVDHKRVLKALRSPTQGMQETISHHTLHGPVTGEYGFTMAESINLDDHQAFAGVNPEQHNKLHFNGDHDDIVVGTYILGSHEGEWNNQIEESAGRRLLGPSAEGITLSRRVVAVEKFEGNTIVTTEAAHPQEAVASSMLKVSFKGSKSPAARLPHRSLSGNRELSRWCEDACASTEYYQPDGGDIAICDMCFEYDPSFSLFNFNYDATTRKAKEHTVNLGLSGVECDECWAYLGADMDLELEFSGISIKHFKLEVGGSFGFNYDFKMNNGGIEFQNEVEGEVTEFPSANNEKMNIPILSGFLKLLDIDISGEYEAVVSGIGSAQGSIEAGGGMTFDSKMGVEFNKGSMGKAAQTKLIGRANVEYTEPYFRFKGFQTYGMMSELELKPKLVFDVKGGSFPFSALVMTSKVGVDPHIGYQVSPAARGNFKIVSPTSGQKFVAGDTMPIEVEYSDYDQQHEVLFFALSNDCWGDEEEGTFIAIEDAKLNFHGSGTMEIPWKVPYNEAFSVSLDGDSSSWTCDETKYWKLHLKLATQPFLEIDPSDNFELKVNYENGAYSEGLGVTSPAYGDSFVGSGERTIEWDDDHFTYYASESGTTQGVIKKVPNVDIMLHTYQCAIGSFWCYDNTVTLTDESGTRNDGIYNAQIDQCTDKGIRLSDANDVFALVVGKENTDVAGRSASFSVTEPTCSNPMYPMITIGKSHIVNKDGYELQLSAEIIGGDSEFSYHVSQEYWGEGSIDWNFEATFDQDGACTHDCVVLKALQNDGITSDSSCILFSASVAELRSHALDEWVRLTIEDTDCSWITDQDGDNWLELKWSDDMSAFTDPLPKKVGFYCSSEAWGTGTNSYTICPPGFFCPGHIDAASTGCWATNPSSDGASKVECPIGYTSYRGSSSSSDCYYEEADDDNSITPTPPTPTPPTPAPPTPTPPTPTPPTPTPPTPTPSTPPAQNCLPDCRMNWLDDNECDGVCDNAACDYDSGDCTSHTIVKAGEWCTGTGWTYGYYWDTCPTGYYCPGRGDDSSACFGADNDLYEDGAPKIQCPSGFTSFSGSSALSDCYSNRRLSNEGNAIKKRESPLRVYSLDESNVSLNDDISDFTSYVITRSGNRKNRHLGSSCDKLFYGLGASGGLTEVKLEIDKWGVQKSLTLYKDEDGQFQKTLSKGEYEQPMYDCTSDDLQEGTLSHGDFGHEANDHVDAGGGGAGTIRVSILATAFAGVAFIYFL
mmetsp:Transcript_18923/g.35092  ORF Transcript_18923/g.35092 Transcript_18923/m.35092 type:complete len:1244 (+) Transcript_18923:51-3782(+)|eukprot:CAMPEP_0182503962 /NCGR_PEP_ID=MMETSP1321-20130603/16315_1 /TAXON_ID=91990 /ORGANISM="Bolidomonas sp., Strain RCC1657" /LENGTH=1243 /DNA_ID=CAMNT_0024709219 /DNA_START=11 /DNA_END=3742 /DNA_ORIENTATION=+